jgi:hypothetical protein
MKNKLSHHSHQHAITIVTQNCRLHHRLTFQENNMAASPFGNHCEVIGTVPRHLVLMGTGRRPESLSPTTGRQMTTCNKQAVPQAGSRS